MDLNKLNLTDDELEKIANDQMESLSEGTLKKLAGETEKEPGVLDYAFRGLNYVSGLGRGAVAKGLVEPLTGKELVTAKQIGEGTVPSTSEILAKLNVPEGYSLSEIIPSMYSPTGKEWLKFEKGGMLDPSVRGAAGLVGDIALDPTTYILPGLKGVGVLGKPLASTASKIGPVGTRAAEIAFNPLGEAATVTARGLGKVGKAVAGKLSQFSPEEAFQYLRNPTAVKEATELLSDKRNLDIAQQKAFEAVNKMRKTLRSAGEQADQQMSEILEGKNVQANLNSIKQLAENMPEKKKAEVLSIVAKAEKDLKAYRPFEPEFLSTSAEQRGVSGLEVPEVKTPAEMIPPSVVQEVQLQPELFSTGVVTKVEPGITPSEVVKLGAGGYEQIPASMIPSKTIEETIQTSIIPDIRSAQISGSITPPKLISAGRSEFFPTEISKFSELLQEPLALPSRSIRPESATIGAPQARRLKQLLQEEASYGKSSPITSKGAPRYTEYSEEANKLREALRGIEKVSELDDYMRQGIVLQEALEKAETAPLQFLKTQSEDITAGLARAARRTEDKEVFDLANQLSAARKIIGKGDYDDWVSRSGIRLMGRASLKAIDKFQKTGKATREMLNTVIKDPNVPPQVWMEMLRPKQEEQP